MPAGTSVAIMRDIQTLFDTGTASGLSDRQLLERFASCRDASAEAAFEVLVLRHGPMVLRVCRNVLGNSTDAQDAFQATFLVLVRRYGSIRRLDSIGGWLYGVACRVAARARVEASRHRAAEHRAALRVVEAVDPPDACESDPADFGPVIQEEVRRLPAKYRAVVVLCYWQGLTQEQAAVQLGCPLGTVRSRLARARDLLRRRLVRRGLAPLAGIVAASLDGATASARALPRFPVPSELVHSTIRAASQVAFGQASAPVVSGLVTSLVQRVVWSMTMSKISSVVVGVAVVGLMGYGARVAVSKGQVEQAKRQVAQASGEDGKKATSENQKGDTAGSMKAYALVEGQTTIISIIPDGSKVKKGDIVCELDSASLNDQAINQKITSESAKAIYENAKLTREITQIALTEYIEGLLVEEQVDRQLDIKIAEIDLALAEDHLEELKAQNADIKKRVTAELVLKKARFALERAESRRKTLLDFSRPRRIKELQSEVEKAQANARAKKAIWELQVIKEKKLERMIANCVIRAPRDGTLVYGNPRDEGRATLIAEGATVRERQVLFEIVPDSGAKPKSGEEPKN
jgi:HlyD family secretion protein